MSREIHIATLSGGEVAFSADALDALARAIDGRLVCDDTGGRAALTVQCAGARDVASAVRFAADRDLAVAVAGGGQVGGAGVLLDLSGLRGVKVEAAQRLAHVEAGALAGDVDRETQRVELAVPLGENSTTSVADVLRAGGCGWLSRRDGLAIDNLRAVELCTADGVSVHCSERDQPDLFWAVRGGSGRCGVVTSFEFGLHEVGPELWAGLLVFAGDRAALLRRFRDLAGAMPDALTAWLFVRQAPPLPFLPKEVHGKDVVMLAVCWAGDVQDGERVVAPLRGLGTLVGDSVQLTSYLSWQSTFDPWFSAGMRNQWQTHGIAELSDPVIEVVLDACARLPTQACEIVLAQLGGAVARVPRDATAYEHRNAAYLLNVHARWQIADDDARCLEWTRAVTLATAPLAISSGVSSQRLAELERQYDPSGRFRASTRR